MGAKAPAENNEVLKTTVAMFEMVEDGLTEVGRSCIEASSDFPGKDAIVKRIAECRAKASKQDADMKKKEEKKKREEEEQETEGEQGEHKSAAQSKQNDGSDLHGQELLAGAKRSRCSRSRSCEATAISRSGVDEMGHD